VSLDGLNDCSYWSAQVSGQEPAHSDDQSLEIFLANQLIILEQHSALFSRLTNEGGRVEFFIGLFGSSNFGFVLDHALVLQLASIHVSLSFDIYP